MEGLGIDIKLMTAQIINFALFFYLFKKYLSKPFFQYIEKQKKQEKEKEIILEELQKDKETTDKKRQEIIKEAREEGKKIINDAKLSAKKIHDDIVKKAQDEAVSIRDMAEKQIETERQKMYKELKRHIVETSALIVRLVLKDYIDEKRQRELLQSITKQIKKQKIYEN